MKFLNSATVTGTLDVTGAATVSTTLGVTGLASLAGGALIDNNVAFRFKDSGAVSRRIGLLSGGNTIYYGDIDNAMNADLLLMAGGTGVAKFYRNGAIAATLASSGLSLVAGLTATTGAFSGAATLSSTLAVAGTSTFSGSLSRSFSQLDVYPAVSALDPSFLGSLEYWFPKNRFVTATYEYSVDGTTAWTGGTFQPEIVDGLGGSSTSLSGSYKGFRWTWTGMAYSYISLFRIQFAYSAFASPVTVTIETSPTGSVWTTRKTVNISGMYSSTLISETAFRNTADDQVRVTITRADANAMPLGAIDLLTYRVGDQGAGFEKNFPFTWDSSRNISLSNDLTVSGGDLLLNNGTSNFVNFGTNGIAAPTFTTRSAGTKMVLYSNITGSAVDYAIGVENSTFWSSVSTTAQQFKWYGGTTLAATLSGTGALSLVAGLTATTGSFSGTLSVSGATNSVGNLTENSSRVYTVANPPSLPTAPASTATTGTASVGTTETRDAVLGDYVFTALASHRYKACLDGLVMSGGAAADIYRLTIRNGGASTPTAASTLVASSLWYCPAAGGAGQGSVPLANTFVPGAGTVTLSMFTLRTSGAGVASPLVTGGLNRQLYVIDLGIV